MVWYLQYRSSYQCSVRKVFLEISQISQEKNCARVSFLIVLEAWDLKKETLAQVFSCEFCEIFYKHLWATASDNKRAFTEKRFLKRATPEKIPVTKLIFSKIADLQLYRKMNCFTGVFPACYLLSMRNFLNKTHLDGCSYRHILKFSIFVIVPIAFQRSLCLTQIQYFISNSCE